MTVPISTYRLQIRAGFDLHAAAELAGYMQDLGIDWVYVSPLLEASEGSDHGYDVVDFSRIDPARGGPEGLLELAESARARGMGILVDIVPNHVGVGVPRENAWWWDVLTNGRDSRYAEAFDIDWDAGGGRLRIPVLGDPSTGSGQATDDLSIVDGELDYFGLRFPIAPGTGEGTPSEVHDRQHYELVDWRRADSELNYRRFFAINSLAAVRVEVPWVFDESHAKIIRWVTEGLVDGVRVDHPDGLLDPGAYLDDLARATGSTYVLVEKILEGDEALPPHWQVAGTTGYDALADIERVLVDPEGRSRLSRFASDLHDKTAPAWADLIHDTRRAIADGILNSEVRRIARLIPEIPAAADAIAEIAACFPVYRTYLPHGAEHLTAAMDDARTRRSDLGETFDALEPVLFDISHPAAQRMQQTTGMIMAKGVEDTAFYRYSRLASLTEVGGDPAEFSINLAQFHERQEKRQASHPASLTALSTHDTKRGEDVRARIDVLSEIPEEWTKAVERWRERVPVGDGPFENLLWESIVGAWPASRGRLYDYAIKASREAGVSTTWIEPNEEFEKRLAALVDAAFDDEILAADLTSLVARVSQPGWSNSLAAKLIQITAPGVPDVYQGSEFWETSLVDPDNRRPVDFEARRATLAELDAGALPPIDESGAAKLLVTSRALRTRRDRQELFTRYVPLTVVGEAADHAIAFDRGGAVTIATRLPVGLAERGGWGDTTILLPSREMQNVITGDRFEGGELRVGDILNRYPVALLVTP